MVLHEQIIIKEYLEDSWSTWFDGLTIAAKAPNPDGAAKFIDFMVSPEFYVRWDTDVGAPASANAKANAELPADAMNRAILGGDGLYVEVGDSTALADGIVSLLASPSLRSELGAALRAAK